MRNKIFSMIINITLKTEHGVILINQKLTLDSLLVSTTKKPRERMLPVSVGTQDIKISLLLVMVTTISNVKEEVVPYAFTQSKTSNGQNTCSQQRKV